MKGADEKKVIGGKPKAVCLLCILALTILLLFAFTGCDFFSTDIYLKDFKMDIELGEDGSMTVTETAKAYFSSQDTNWYNFYRIIDDERALDHPMIDGESFMLDGKSIPMETENDGLLDLDSRDSSYWKSKYKNHAVGYYCLRQSGLEIGVVMPSFESGTHTFSYRYTLKNALTPIKDAAVFYYKYVSEINTMDIKNMDVTVSFPKAEPDLRAWLHVSAGAEGYWKAEEGNEKMTVHAEGVKQGEYVETRAILDRGNYILAGEREEKTSVDIEEEERKWFESYKRKQAILLAVTIGDYALAALAIAAAVILMVALKKKNRPLSLPDAPIYYRDIPDGYTGGEVSPLYFYYSNENYTDESISATMLELVRLKYISIAPDEGSKSAKITVLKADEDDSLRTHQKIVLEMLMAVRPFGESFTMKEFEKHGKNNPTETISFVDRYKAVILNKSQREGAYRSDNPFKESAQRAASTFVGIGIGGIVLSGALNFFFNVGLYFAPAGFFLGAIISFFASRKAKAPLTVAGQREYDKLRALSRFMQEFSNMDDHEIPELVLWEDYMVFAAAMGIADKVAEQLEIKYPEFKRLTVSDFDATDFIVLYFFSSSFRSLSGLNFIGNVSGVIRSAEIARRALKAAEFAKNIRSGGGGGFGGGSGFSGGGGGFSGGGFGGRR